jgi:E3 ubiquitin-protein ligase HECTD2
VRGLARGSPSRSGNQSENNQSGRQSHARAVSLGHAFPGLFARGRRGGVGANGSGDDDDSSSVPHQHHRDGKAPNNLGLETRQNNHSPYPKSKGAGSDGGNLSKEMVTGKCMTCDSLVRWPRELSVFRCTVCLTINDLHPVALEVRKGDWVRFVKAGKESGKGGASVSPLSIERTRELIEDCVVEYLLGRLTHGNDDIMKRRGDAIGRKDVQEAERAASSLPSTDLSELPIMMENMGWDESEPRRGRKDGYGKDGIRSSEAQLSAVTPKDSQAQQGRTDTFRSIFEPLENYIISSFGTLECINNSFRTSRPSTTLRTVSEDKGKNRNSIPDEKQVQSGGMLSELDAKTLLLGDIAENSSWWTGGRTADSSSPERKRPIRSGESANDVLVTLKSPRIDWADANEWYYLVLNAGRSWREKLNELMVSGHHPKGAPLSDEEMDEIEIQITEAEFRTQRALLKAIESLLKRPGRPLQEPGDLRFLLIILANPLLYPAHSSSRSSKSRSRSPEKNIRQELSPSATNDKGASPGPTQAPASSKAGRGSSGRHSGIIKRILGLLSNLSNECHHHLVSWFARYSDGQFQSTTDLIGSFVTYRLTRQNGVKREVDQDPTAGLVPSMSSSGRNTSAALHAALGSSSGQLSTKSDGKPQAVVYNDDWQIKAAARVMALFFSANNSGLSRKGNTRTLVTPENGQSVGLAARERAHMHGQILPTSDFYNTLLDYSDLIADFEAWESKRGKFTFCQYPFFLSIWAKIQIMEHDARRQMEVQAREAFFNSIMTHKIVNQYLVLKIRRDCLVEDSLKGVSEVVGSGDEEIKKGLRIEFKGEEGIDAGGLRKEWFLLLVRDVFNPEHGMYIL